MKYVAAIAISFIVLLNSLSKMTTIAAFYANQDYIAANLCEARANPCSHCYGKCQLKKQLEAQDRQEDKLPAQTSHEETMVFFTLTKSISLNHLTNFCTKTDFYYPERIILPLSPNGIFHPPC